MAENKETKGFIQVYKSTNTIPCEPWFAPADAEIAYPYVKDVPDPKLNLPKYDWNNYRWYETDGAIQGQELAEISKQVQQLSKDVASGKLSNEAINEQLGTLVGLVSASAMSKEAESNGGAK